MPERVFLILHGWGGNKPEHWQEHLVRHLEAAGETVYYPKMPDPMAPNLAAWQARLTEELGKVKAENPDAALHVLTHSLGAINWLHYAATMGVSLTPIAERVLLIAPPYVLPEAPPVDAPPGVTAFFPPPFAAEALKSLARETVLIASDTDDYATFDQTGAYAAKLDIPLHKLAGAGHISPYYGYGEWPWVFDWCVGNAELPPLPRA